MSNDNSQNPGDNSSNKNISGMFSSFTDFTAGFLTKGKTNFYERYMKKITKRYIQDPNPNWFDSAALVNALLYKFTLEEKNDLEEKRSIFSKISILSSGLGLFGCVLVNGVVSGFFKRYWLMSKSFKLTSLVTTFLGINYICLYPIVHDIMDLEDKYIKKYEQDILNGNII